MECRGVGKGILVFLLALFLLPSLGEGIEPKYNYVSGWSPPPAKPHRRAGGESFPPLPLPVAPLRRTEKKRPPAPPVLMVKLRYGKGRQWVGYWNNEVYLVNYASRKLGLRYRGISLPESLSSWLRKGKKFNPEEAPVIFMTGLVSFQFTDEEREALRKYLEGGGTLLLDCNSGNEEIFASFREELKKMFPSSPLYPLPLDHPVYHSFYDISGVKYQIAPQDPRIYNPDWKGTYPQPRIKAGYPLLYGIDIGYRTAVFLSRYGLGCGWAGKTLPYGSRYLPSDSLKIGTNIIAYALQFYPVGKYLSVQKTFNQPRFGEEEVTIAQVMHRGYWDPSPTRLSNLLRWIAENTTSRTSFRVKEASLEEGNLFSYPILYFTGHWDFRFSEREVKNLRAYLVEGGFLFAENRGGWEVFDRAFRREMKRVFPEKELVLLPPDHPLYQALNPIDKVGYDLKGIGEVTEVGRPYLEAILLGDNAVVVYSKYDLGWGWQDEIRPPFVVGLERRDSLRLASNIFAYALTH